MNLTNATLTLTNGVAVAIYGQKGTTLLRGARFISEGQPHNLNRLVRYNTVQEQANTNWIASPATFFSLLNIPSTATPPPEVRMKWTHVVFMAESWNHRQLVESVGGYAFTTFAFNDCRWNNAVLSVNPSVSSATTVALTNNLIERGWLDLYKGNDTPFTAHLRNNLLRGGTLQINYGALSINPTWEIRDNLFESSAVTENGNGYCSYVANSQNGYYPHTASKLQCSGGGDVTLTNIDYQTSFLGSFYYPTTGTNLARLLNAGSRTASSAGLSNFTTTTNQVGDSGTVDIGYHSLAVSTNTIVTIQTTIPVASEGGGNGQFTVFRTGSTSSNLTVYYKVEGTAIPGTDYQALSGSATIGIGSPSQEILVVPTNNNTITFDKTVIASLILTNTYFVGSPGQATVTVQDTDPLSTNVVVASINGPSGIDYHPVNSSLIISRNDPSGNENNFKRLSTSVLTNWTTASGLGFTNPGGNPGELKVGIVKTSTNNWTRGDQYFGPGQPGKIGKITANGSSVNTNWATLTNSSQMVGESNVFIGGLYIDQTGVWNGDLIVVTGSGGVWRVTATTNATKVAQINDANGSGISLEGVLTVPNDSSKYGPWAGKILTCAEEPGFECAVDTNGVVTLYNLGLGAPEDVRLIPSGQNLYSLDFNHNRVLKVTADNFSNFAGDILLVDEGVDPNECALAGLYVVHWTGGAFVVRQIPIAAELEHVTFAPIDIPAVP